jgi:hypothetical protein
MYILLVGILCIVVHEAGHVFAGISVGARYGGCRIRWNGLRSYPYVLLERTSSPFRNAFIASGGILTNLLTSLLMYAFHTPGAWVPWIINLACWADWKRSDPYQMLCSLREYRQYSTQSVPL